MADVEGGPVIDTEFAATKYGLLRITQFAIGFLSLIVIEIAGCKYRQGVNFFFFVATATLVFSILIIILFCTRFYEKLGQYINIPLSILVNESIAVVLWSLASLFIFFATCPGEAGSKIAFVICGILGLLGVISFVYSAQISYNWFRNGDLSAS